MLTITNVRKTFNKGTVNEKKALNGINLHLNPGDFVTVIGEMEPESPRCSTWWLACTPSTAGR